MTLYNLKSSDGEWRITKFDNDLNPLSSYIVSEVACECPSGHRSTCRHRQMLPGMIAKGIADSGGFYDFERQQFLVPIGDQVEPRSGLPATTSGLPASTSDPDPILAKPAPAELGQTCDVAPANHPAVSGEFRRRV